MTLQNSPAADALGQYPPWSWLSLNLERKGSISAEGRFLSDLIVLMQSPFLMPFLRQRLFSTITSDLYSIK